MYENVLSMKTKQQNFLNSKTHSFKMNYKESSSRIKSSSSMNNLAGNIYSVKQNRLMEPKHNIKRLGSVSNLSRCNPEEITTQTLKGLNTRVSHVPNYSDINTDLLLEKRRLQEKISFLKDQILREKKACNKSQMNCKKNRNQIEKASNNCKQLNNRSERLNEGLFEAKTDCQTLNSNIFQLHLNNEEKYKQQTEQINAIDLLDNRCRVLKNNLLQTDKLRNTTKAELIKQQKVMNSSSIFMKQLQQQSALLLLSINNSVVQYRLK